MKNNGSERHRPFVREIEAAAGRHRAADVFVDACHMMACAIWAPLAPDREKVEEDYQRTAGKYNADEIGHIAAAFRLLVEALEEDHTEFLGHCLERCFEATNRGNGQFLTPTHISHMMGRMLSGKPDGGVARLHDPCCGAGVLVIEGANAFKEGGWRQGDICVVAGDIDGRACDMCYVQLSLLGYAGVVRHMDAISKEQFDEPRYTPGWFLHGFPLRGIAA